MTAPRGLKFISENIEPFLKDLKNKGYTGHSYSRHVKTLKWFLDYLNFEKIDQVEKIRREKILDNFIAWKLKQRQQRRYAPEYKRILKFDINRFLDWHFSYDRTFLEERLKKYLAEQKFRYSRKYLEVKNELLSFFDYLERHRFTNLRRVSDIGIANYIDEKEILFYKERKIYNPRSEATNLKAPLKNFYRFLWKKGIKWLSFPLKIPKIERPLRFEEVISAYLDFCEKTKGTKRHGLWTIKHELKKFDWFLQDIGINAISKLKIKYFDEYIKNKFNPENLKAIHKTNHMLRGFLKYLYLMGEHPKDLSKYLVQAPIYTHSQLPKYLEKKDVDNLFKTIDLNTNFGLRLNAMLALLYFNGLRAGEVANLTLDDINWEEKMLVVRERKNDVPLITVLADPAIMPLKEYIFKARPKERPERNIFFKHQAPITPIRSGSVVTQVMRHFRKNGFLEGGSHRLRHSFATHMLESGRSLGDVQEHLGHERKSSTQVYAKTSIEQMRKYCCHNEF